MPLFHIKILLLILIQSLDNYFNSVDIKNLYTAGSIISFGNIQVNRSLSATMPIKTKSTKLPLMIARKYGQGNIIYLALELHSQLLNIQPEAYQFLKNLLSN